MKPHQERVVVEKAELDAKCDKLRTFITGDVFKTLDDDEQNRLTRQLEVMTEYSQILEDRIENFE